MNKPITTDDKTIDFETSCKDCIFAKFKNGIQTRCLFHDRLSIYQDLQLAELVEEDNLEFFKINTVCNAKRSKELYKDIKTPKTIVKLVEKEIALKTTHVFICNTMLDVIRLASDLSAKDSEAVGIFILLGFDPDIKALLKINNKYILTVPLDRTNVPAAIDGAVKNVKTTFYTVWDNSEVDMEHLEKIKQHINFELNKCVCYQTKKNSLNGLSVSTYVHRMFHGNDNMPIYEKIKEAADYQKNEEAYYCASQH